MARRQGSRCWRCSSATCWDVDGADPGLVRVAELGEHGRVQSERGADLLDLAPGASLLLYTDGLVERRGMDIDASLARPREAADGSTADPGAWIDDVARRLGVSDDDDTTLLAFRRSLSA